MSFGENLLIKRLRESSPKGENYYDCNATTVSYKSGFPVLDYYLGYLVNVFNTDDQLEYSYPNIGIPGGCFVTGIGKPSTSKTTTFIQIAANIVRPFANGSVIHYDLEQALNYSRIQVLTKFTMQEMFAGKYILRQERSSISDIKRSIIRLYKEKVDNPTLYKYKTGKKNEFGEEIEIFEPTVVIIDSIATLSAEVNENDKKDYKKLEDVTSQTDRMRLTGEISRFFTELLPYLRAANIVVLTINQIKVNPGMGVMPSPADILYLKQGESLPGGRAPQYLAHILLKFVAIGSEKYTMEENGFDGFGVAVEIIKSRTNQAGQRFDLVYDKVKGIDSLRSTLNFAKEVGLLAGNKNKSYFINNKEESFSMINVHEDFAERKELYKIMYENVIPVLEHRLSAIKPEEMHFVAEEYDY